MKYMKLKQQIVIDLEHVIDVDWVSTSTLKVESDLISHWAVLALNHCSAVPTEISVKVVDKAEIRQLNAEYRGKQSETNVLSFPLGVQTENEKKLLGDLVICADVVQEEALAQNKLSSAHFAHMVVHGVLHLLGYDHIKEDDAEVMEEKEIKILRDIGIANPYIEPDNFAQGNINE